MNPEDKAIFDKERFDLGVKLVCDAFDEAGLTMAERFRASYILAVVTATDFGLSVRELAEKMGLAPEKLPLAGQDVENEAQDGPEEAPDEVEGGE